MADYLAPILFICLMALFYLVVISRYGVLERRIRAWQSEREQMRNDWSRASQLKQNANGTPASDNGHNCDHHGSSDRGSREWR